MKENPYLWLAYGVAFGFLVLYRWRLGRRISEARDPKNSDPQ